MHYEKVASSLDKRQRIKGGIGYWWHGQTLMRFAYQGYFRYFFIIQYLLIASSLDKRQRIKDGMGYWLQDQTLMRSAYQGWYL